MKKSVPFISIVFGIIACILVFTSIFKTPPTPITIFSILGIITGVIGLKEHKPGAIFGMILNIAALGYLIYLFAGLSA